MLKSINEIIGYSLIATDGEIGNCHDFLFEDRPWIVRYVVADTGQWLIGRKVLLPLMALEGADGITKWLHVNLTKSQIKGSPPLSDDEPVSRQYEEQSFSYYGWPAYWQHSGSQEDDEPESFLRSAKEVTGYTVRIIDDTIGTISDFIVDDSIWAIRYGVIATDEAFGNRLVLVAPEWISSVDFLKQSANIELTTEQIEKCPEYNPAEPVNRDYESILYDYYGRPYYWTEDGSNE